MRVEHVEIETHSGAASGARSATRAWSERRGILVEVVTPEGIVGRGEATPLPGYSPDEFETALRALNRVDWTALPEPEAEVGGPALFECLRRVGRVSPLPSVRFAVETAFLDIAGQRASRPIWSLLDEHAASREPVRVSSMVGSADDPNVVDAARAAVQRGVSTVKLKVAGPLSRERIERVHAVRRAVGDLRIRLDANGSFPEDSASRDLEALCDADIEFIEEPVASAALSSLANPAIPIAFDESLQTEDAWIRASSRFADLRCVALVLKPMALGGFSACLDWIERAHGHGLEVTISHLFDGPVALTACAHLAVAFGSRRYASGLDVHGALGAWPPFELPLHGARTELVAGELPGLGLRPPLRGDR